MNLFSPTFGLRRKEPFFFFFFEKVEEIQSPLEGKGNYGYLSSRVFLSKVMFKNDQAESYKNEQVLCENDEGNFRHNRSHLRKLPGEQRRRFCLQK